MLRTLRRPSAVLSTIMPVSTSTSDHSGATCGSRPRSSSPGTRGRRAATGGRSPQPAGPRRPPSDGSSIPQCRSRSCASSTRAGAPVSGSCPGLRLRERDDVADVVPARQEHDQPVQAERDPAVGRHAVAERPEHVAELLLGLLAGDPEDLEDALLQVGSVDPDRSRRRARSRSARCRRRAPSRSPGRGRRRRGAVNGWWFATHRPSSSLHSNSGNSVIHRSPTAPSGTRSSRSARSRRQPVERHRDAVAAGRPRCRMRSPVAGARSRSRTPPARPCDRNFATGERSAPPSSTTHPDQPRRAPRLRLLDQLVELLAAERRAARRAERLDRAARRRRPSRTPGTRCPRTPRSGPRAPSRSGCRACPSRSAPSISS